MDEEIFSTGKDIARARDLLEMAKERLEDLQLTPKIRYYKLIEEEYEIIKELLTAVMYSDGYKTLSHKKLIEYFAENYESLDETQIKLIDNLRKLRNDILYYGKKIGEEYLINYEKDIKDIIDILTKFVENKIKNG